MSADDGSVKNTLGSESSCSTTSAAPVCGDGRRRKDYGKKDRKTVRILTVMAYILCVSMAAVLLSAYYVFLWNPGPVSAEKPLRMGMGTSGGLYSSTGPGNRRFMAYPTTVTQVGTSQQQDARYHGNHGNHGTYGNQGNHRKVSSPLSSSLLQFQSQLGSAAFLSNTSPYQNQQIPTPLPLLMTTHFLTTLPQGVPTTKATTTSPTPPFFKSKFDPKV